MPRLRYSRDDTAVPARRPIWRRVLTWTGVAAAILSGVALAATIAIVVALNQLAPDVSQPDLYALNRPASLTFFDEHDQPAGQRGAILGQKVTLNELPRYVPEAFIAQEDRNFYLHRGIDPAGMLRAAIVNFESGHVEQGGSTITQQLVKMLFLTPDRTMSRKLREMGGALALERRLSKQQILELYLNRVYLGSGAYGIDAAAHVYFNKPARDLTVGQAAMLAALTRAPSAFSPRRDLAAAQDRANEVLEQMVEIGAITPEQAQAAEQRPAVVTAASGDDLARNYFLDAAADEVRQLLPTAQGDLKVYTTLEPELESAAWSQLAGVLNRRGRALHATQGALVSIATDGAVRALIGGRDYAESSFNRVTNAHRQPGSAFKAFVYLAAFEQGLTPATVRVDQPVSLQDMSKVWTPDNYTRTYLGPITLEQAFAKSINTIAVQLGQEIGIPNVVAAAHRLGIESPLDPVPSLAIGTSDVTPLELTAANGAFATVGHKVEPFMVREIRGSDDNVLYTRPANSAPQVFSEDTGLEMNDLFYQVVQEGTGHAAEVPGHDVGGKTGTSADYRDAWFIGFSPDLVTGVWVGNDDSSPMKQVTGGLLPAEIWGGFMRVALANRPDTPLPRAEPVPETAVMAQSGTDNSNSATPDSSSQSNAPGPFDGIGRFFGGLFGNNPTPAPSPAPPQRSAQDRPDFFTGRRRTPAAAPTPDNTGTTFSDGGSTSGSTGTGSNAGGSITNNTAADQAPAAPPPPPSRQYSAPPPPPPSNYGTQNYRAQNFGAPPSRQYTAPPPSAPSAPAYGGQDNGPPPDSYAGRSFGAAQQPYGGNDMPPPRYRQPPPGYYSAPPGYYGAPPANYPPPPPDMPPPQAYAPGSSGSGSGQRQGAQDSGQAYAGPQTPDQGQTNAPPAPDSSPQASNTGPGAGPND